MFFEGPNLDLPWMTSIPFIIMHKTLEDGISIHEGRLFVCIVLFCSVWFVIMRSTELGCFRSYSWSLWKAYDERGASAWFHDVWTCSAKVLEY
jgi:hypothetical protein